jgi:hypothetical protein
LEREPENSATHPITPLVATPLSLDGQQVIKMMVNTAFTGCVDAGGGLLRNRRRVP